MREFHRLAAGATPSLVEVVKGARRVLAWSTGRVYAAVDDRVLLHREYGLSGELSITRAELVALVPVVKWWAAHRDAWSAIYPSNGGHGYGGSWYYQPAGNVRRVNLGMRDPKTVVDRIATPRRDGPLCITHELIRREPVGVVVRLNRILEVALERCSATLVRLDAVVRERYVKRCRRPAVEIEAGEEAFIRELAEKIVREHS